MKDVFRRNAVDTGWHLASACSRTQQSWAADASVSLKLE
jgi:hypothetical protein